ncbi:unnamed protein product [Knipowitschia caucasica]
MAQPPGRADDHQTPQDLSTSSRTEQCAVVRRNPGWYQNSDQGSPILPDNALSRTTVTLSYVSRSHVFSTQDSLCGNSNVYGVPTFSKYSLQPLCQLDASSNALDQPFLENIDGPIDTDLLQSLSEAQLDLDLETNLKQTFELGTSEQHNVLQSAENIWLSDSLQSTAASLPECHAAFLESEKSNSSCKETGHFRDNHCSLENNSATELLKSLQSMEAVQEDAALALTNWQEVPKTLPVSLELVSNEEGIPNQEKSSAEEPAAPLGSHVDSSEEWHETGNDFQPFPDDTGDILERDSPQIVCESSTHPKPLHTQVEDTFSPATSLDKTEDLIILPDTSSLPSRNSSLLKITDAVSEDCTTGLRSNIRRQPPRRRKSALEPLIDLTDDLCMADVLEGNINSKVLNGSAKALQTTSGRKLPKRSGKGMRLEAIVMNINSSQYNVSGCIRARRKSPKTKLEEVMPRKSNRLSRNHKCNAKSEKPEVSPRNIQAKASHSKKSTSDNHEALQAGPVQSKHKCSPGKTLSNASTGGISPITEFPKCQLKRPGKANHKAKAKTKCTSKKKRKKIPIGNASSMFSPKEPEIKLKYLNYKEEKRSQKTDRFSPFVRVHRQPQAPSLCTVLSNPEEVKTPRKSGQASTEYASVNVPATSCLRLGRVSMHGAQQRALVCCLCKQAANAMDLGDLHGPYYSQGYQPPPKIPHDQSGLKEGESSDSDSSSCSATKWTSIKRQLKWKAAEGSSHVVKRARAEVDWYTPPILPLDPCEYWLHEDCGVWATGVFLIRGRLYGLEEAVKAAHNAECCACGGPGASLGCLSKACPSKYHYRCALRSDCALDQDNFSMRCRKHKNVSMRGLTSRRLEPS